MSYIAKYIRVPGQDRFPAADRLPHMRLVWTKPTTETRKALKRPFFNTHACVRQFVRL